MHEKGKQAKQASWLASNETTKNCPSPQAYKQHGTSIRMSKNVKKPGNKIQAKPTKHSNKQHIEKQRKKETDQVN